jgi:N-acetylglutamate synthase-like GNAT family acetyltransferase
VQLTIRPFQAGEEDGNSDTNAIRNLILPIQNEEFSLPTSWEEQPDLHDIPGYYCQGRGNFWVAEADDGIVGSISLVELANDNSALRKMFVAADYRGGDAGVAAGLLATLVDHARETSLKQIFLGTTDAFKAAHRFYEKHGFDQVERELLPPDFSFMKVDTRFYRLVVA